MQTCVSYGTQQRGIGCFAGKPCINRNRRAGQPRVRCLTKLKHLRLRREGWESFFPRGAIDISPGLAAESFLGRECGDCGHTVSRGGVRGRENAPGDGRDGGGRTLLRWG